MLRSVFFLLTITVAVVLAKPRPDEVPSTTLEPVPEPAFNYRVNYRWTKVVIDKDDFEDNVDVNGVIVNISDQMRPECEVKEQSLNLVCRLRNEQDDKTYENYIVDPILLTSFESKIGNFIDLLKYSAPPPEIIT